MYATAIKSAEKTYLPMLAGIGGIVCNTIFNYMLIFGHGPFPAMGVEGAALATTLSACVTMLINIAFAYGKRLPAGAKPSEWFCKEPGFASRFVKTAVPVVFNEGLWGLGTTMFSVFYGRMGDAAVATMGVCNTINDLVWVAIFALMNACAILVGKTLGSGDKERAYLYGKRLISGRCAGGASAGRGGLSAALAPGEPVLRPERKCAAEGPVDSDPLAALSIWFRALNTVNVVGVLRSGGDTRVQPGIWRRERCGSSACLLTGLAALCWHWPLEAVYLCTVVEEVVKMAHRHSPAQEPQMDACFDRSKGERVRCKTLIWS